MYNKLIKVILKFNKRNLKVHNQSMSVTTLKQYLADKGKEITPVKSGDNFLIGIWMLNYLTVCGYFKVVDISNIGKNRRYFIKDIDFDKVNEFKLYSDLIESLIYGKTLLHERSFGGNNSKLMILNKFKSIYLVNKLPRTPQESIDLLNKYFHESNIMGNIALFNDIYGIKPGDPRSSKLLHDRINEFNHLYVDKDGSIKCKDSLMKLMSLSCNLYDFIGKSNELTDYSEFFNSIEFFNNYFTNKDQLNEFIKSSRELIRKLKSRVNHDIKDNDNIIMYNRSLITDKDLLKSFKIKNINLIKMIGS